MSPILILVLQRIIIAMNKKSKFFNGRSSTIWHSTHLFCDILSPHDDATRTVSIGHLHKNV